MRTIAIWLYITAFTGAILSSWLGGVGSSSLEMAFDVVLSSVTVAGLIFYALRVPNQKLIGAWKIIAPLILAGHVVQAAIEVPRLVRLRPGQEVFIALTAFFLIPAIVINFRFANALHLTGQHPLAADEHSIASRMTPRFGSVVACVSLGIGLWLFFDSRRMIIVNGFPVGGSSPGVQGGFYTPLGLWLQVSDPSHFRHVEWWTGIALIVAALTFWIGQLWARGRDVRRAVSADSTTLSRHAVHQHNIAIVVAFLVGVAATLGGLALLAATHPFAPVWLRFAAPVLWIGGVGPGGPFSRGLALSTANFLLWTLVAYYLVRGAQRFSGTKR